MGVFFLVITETFTEMNPLGYLTEGPTIQISFAFTLHFHLSWHLPQREAFPTT